MPIEGAEFKAAAAPPVGTVVGGREDARLRRNNERPGASIAIGLAAIALAALSAVALWLSA